MEQVGRGKNSEGSGGWIRIAVPKAGGEALDFSHPSEKSRVSPRPHLGRTEVWTLSCDSYIKKWPKVVILKL